MASIGQISVLLEAIWSDVLVYCCEMEVQRGFLGIFLVNQVGFQKHLPELQLAL